MPERRRNVNAIHRQAENFARSRVGAWYFINVAMRIDRVLLPVSGGRLSMGFGQQVGLLETTGAKSGERRRIPLLYLRDGNHVVLVASKGGNVKHPAWYHNLKANPDVTLEVGTDKYAATAMLTSGEERERLYTAQAKELPIFNRYAEKAAPRVIPVFRFVRKPA